MIQVELMKQRMKKVTIMEKVQIKVRRVIKQRGRVSQIRLAERKQEEHKMKLMKKKKMMMLKKLLKQDQMVNR